jgi:2-polyprenylphenol 6-hydroxylase
MTHHFFQSVDKSIETDVAIVGAGLVGLSAAIAFAKQGKSVVLVDAKPAMNQKNQTWDERIYALSPESETWLKSLDIWQHVETERVCTIDAMHVWHDSEELVLSSGDANLPKLGVIIENQNLMVALWQKINTLDVTVVTEVNCVKLENTQQAVILSLDNNQQVSAKLLLAADGAHSWVREQANIEVKHKDFQQTAIVANFNTEKSHRNIARQWFAAHETLALLPLVGQNVSLVWSVSTEKANELLKLSNENLADAVRTQSQDVLGELKPIGKALSFALHSQIAAQFVAERLALVGDAAHQIHPMAGQGVNLGFRDVMELTSLATKLHNMQDLGDAAFLRQYARARKADTLAMNTLTSGLNALFASDSSVLKQLTSWGLRQLNHQGSIKKLLIQQVAA